MFRRLVTQGDLSIVNKLTKGFAVKDLTTPTSANAQTIANTGTPALLAFEPVSNYVSMGRSRVYALIDDGKFPAPIKIGRSSRWVKSEIDAWIQAGVWLALMAYPLQRLLSFEQHHSLSICLQTPCNYKEHFNDKRKEG